MRQSLLSCLILGLVAASACDGRNSQAEGAVLEQKFGLSAVRLIGPRNTLEKMAKAAAEVRWTESHYDPKGRLILPAPPNYASEDFGRLLEAIGPYTDSLQGLQMLGPNGGPVDDQGIEHPDE